MNVRQFILYFSLALLVACANNPNAERNYKNYHSETIKAERLISQEKYDDALEIYENLFKTYRFTFLRDHKIATQLALLSGDQEKTLHYIKVGISNGWIWQELQENKYLQTKLTSSYWELLKNQYDELHKRFLERIDVSTRDEVERMFNKDQEIAMQVSLIVDEEAQEAFILEQFPEHSEGQIQKLRTILKNKGYPGERLIGNDFWASTILSHHNSIAPEYVKHDTLYKVIKPDLLQALHTGHISPYEIALTEDWKIAVISEHQTSAYGYINAPKKSELAKVNKLRQDIGLRPIELRNKLIEIEITTGIDLYLPDWIEGKIIMESE